jgi:hypothetical protein
MGLKIEEKCTAVEWLIDQVEQFYCLLPVDMIEQAKAMEKQQIIDAYNNGDLRSAELYYDETYGIE